jgi:ABC-type phosphate transport system substrate-binding protein
MKPEEIETAKKNTSKEPKEFIVGYDALAIYMHKDNPLNEITLDQIAQIYMEGGAITKWSDLGVTIRTCAAYAKSLARPLNTSPPCAASATVSSRPRPK